MLPIYNNTARPCEARAPQLVSSIEKTAVFVRLLLFPWTPSRVKFSRLSPTSASPTADTWLQRLGSAQTTTRLDVGASCATAAAAADLSRCTRTPSSCLWRSCVCCSSTCTTWCKSRLTRSAWLGSVRLGELTGHYASSWVITCLHSTGLRAHIATQ